MGNTNTVQNIFNIGEITLNRNNNTVWSLNGPFGLSFTAGAIAGGQYGLHRVNENTDEYVFTYSLIGRPRVGDEALVNIKKITLNNTNADLTSRCQHVAPGYNIWLRDNEDITLYNFENAEFIRGLLTMLQAFNINYREAILEAPLRISVYDGNYVSEYREIQGYPLPIPHPLQEAYTTCSGVLNRGGPTTLTVEDRVNNITPYVREKFAFLPNLDEFQIKQDNILNELQVVFLYTHPQNDNKTVDQYIGFTSHGERANPDTTNHFLTAYGYTEK